MVLLKKRLIRRGTRDTLGNHQIKPQKAEFLGAGKTR